MSGLLNALCKPSRYILNSRLVGPPNSGLTDLMHAVRFPCHVAFTAAPFFLFLLSDQLLYPVKNMCVCVCVCVHIYIYICVCVCVCVCVYLFIFYIYISDCVQTVYELPLLPNNSAKSIFTQIGSGAKVLLNIYLGMPACRWLSEQKTMDKKFYNLLFEQEVIAAPVAFKCSSLSHFSRRTLVEI
jgi:hypothetical protein